MIITSTARLPAGLIPSYEEIKALEADIQAEFNKRMHQAMREDALRFEQEILHGTPGAVPPVGLIAACR